MLLICNIYTHVYAHILFYTCINVNNEYCHINMVMIDVNMKKLDI